MKPPRLSPGDTVGIVSPSWGAAGLFPHRVENGVRMLEAMGLSVRMGRHALEVDGWVSAPAQARAADINDMFGADDVKLVLAAIGGDHSCQLLEYLDFDLIAARPKIFMGYSDITVLNVAIWVATGLTTFNGPALVTDFAEHPQMLAYTRSAFERTVMSAEPIGALAPAPAWTEETLDWGAQLDLTRPRAMHESAGWTGVRGGSADGILVGGCIESLQHLRGTRFWPDFDAAILFVETSENAPSPAVVDGLLSDYANMGVFDKINGLLVGRPMRYSDDDRRALLTVVEQHTKPFGFPVIANMDFGHTAPQMVLPLGCRAVIDGDTPGLFIEEAAVV